VKEKILITLFSLTTLVLFGQDTTKTIQSENRDGYKKWTNYRTSIRTGLGAQESFYFEVGISRLKYIYNDLGYASGAYYGAFEWTPTFSPDKERNIYGLKIGYEINARILALGIETKFQSDRKENDFVITPKIGFGVLGVVNLFYGYNISTTGNPFSRIGNHQFSIVCNLNRHIFKNGKK